jgi:dipeptidyl aminopeptidase/acylaminoacyl peptidase
MADLDGRNIVEPFKMTGTKNKDARDALNAMISASIFKDGLYDQDTVLISRPDPETFDTEIYSVNKKTGETKLVAKDSEKWHYLAGGVDLPTGEPLLREGVDVRDGHYVLITEIKDRATGQWVEHPLLGYPLSDREQVDVLGFDRDPNKIFVLTNRNRDHAALYSYDLKTKTFSDEPLYANDQYDIIAVGLKQDYQKKQFDSISSLTIGGPAQIQYVLTDKWLGPQKAIQAAFPGKNVYLHPAGDGDTALVRVEASDYPTAYYLFDGKALKLIGSERPWIDPDTLGKAEFVTYTARDGLQIPAIITHPPGWSPKSPPGPLVVLPHGGPWARDEMSWAPSGWPQFLATRGVTVIQPQYRGSEGWGDKLWKAGDNQWGLKMSDDNDDAAAYMVSRGIADPHRMAIFGYSYGGFAAIAASVRPNSPYRCAIAGAGVSSLQRVGNLWGGSHIQRDIQGHTVDGMDPLKNVDKANIPIMLYHGDHDRQADTEHSRMFYAAMKAAGKDVEYHEIQGMWHTLPWHPEWQTETLGLIETYLKSPKCGLLD